MGKTPPDLRRIVRAFAGGLVFGIAVIAAWTLPFDWQPIGRWGMFWAVSMTMAIGYFVFFWALAFPMLLMLDRWRPDQSRYYRAMLGAVTFDVALLVIGGFPMLNGLLIAGLITAATVGALVFWLHGGRERFVGENVA